MPGAPLPPIHSMHSPDHSLEAHSPSLLIRCEEHRRLELDTDGLKAWDGAWHRGHLVNPIFHLHLEAHSLSLAKARIPGTLLPRSPTPDTCHRRGLEGSLASRQGLRSPWHFPLILPGLDSLRVKKVLLAQAEAEKIRKIGEAEASVIEAMGKAEAERMKLKAEAYQKYGESAKMALVLEALPQVRVPTQAGTGWAHARTSLGLVMNTVDRLAGRIKCRGQEPYNRHRFIPGPLVLPPMA